MEVLQRRYRPVRLADLAAAVREGDLPKRSVAVTFDDGYADNLHEAGPILARYGVPATVFLVAGALGSDREFWWDELERIVLATRRLPATLRFPIGESPFSFDLEDTATAGEQEASLDNRWRAGEPPTGRRQVLYRALWERLRLLPAESRELGLDRLRSWAGTEPTARSTHRVLARDEVKELANGNPVDIGAHTMTHPRLSLLPASIQREEIEQGKKNLETILGPGRVISFSYPFGDYSRGTVALVHETGFQAACTNASGTVRRSSNLYELPRIHVNDWDGVTFRERLSRWL